MKKILLPALLMFAHSIQSNSQTNATNFTATDCNSNSHTLFTELDNGNVVVLAWVMPCLTCIAPVKTAYNIAKSYNNKPAYAGKVKFYLIDDFADHSCTYLSNWASNNNIGPDILTVFDNAPGGTVIKEDDYGGSGMPHVAIVGGSDHRIFFNKHNDDANDPSGIEYAIFRALTPASVTTANESADETIVFPNPANNKLTIKYSMNNTERVIFEIVDIVGRQVSYTSTTSNPGVNNETIDVGHLTNGTYFLQIKENNHKEILKFSVIK
jgi:hypothetical protein